MTTYTADDFVKASFARHPDGNVAMRHWQHWAPSDEQAESVRFSLLTHDDMAADGWVPVQEPRPLTAREHLDVAWEAARVVPAGTAIAPGVGYITRYEGSGEILASVEGHSAFLPTRGIWGERRLLDPPAPSRPEWPPRVGGPRGQDRRRHDRPWRHRRRHPRRTPPRRGRPRDGGRVVKRRATVERVYRVREGNWYVLIWTDGWFEQGRTFPTHAAALAHALAEVGLTQKEQS